MTFVKLETNAILSPLEPVKMTLCVCNTNEKLKRLQKRGGAFKSCIADLIVLRSGFQRQVMTWVFVKEDAFLKSPM